LTIDTTLNAADDADQDKFALMIRNSADDINEQIGIGFRISANQNATNAPGGAITFQRTTSNSVGDLHFKTAPSSEVLTTRMTIDSSGRVGIGTVSPQYAFLDVANYGTANDNTIARFYASGSAHAGITLLATAANADPRIRFGVDAKGSEDGEDAQWCIGVDNSLDDKFMISNAADLETAPILTIVSGSEPYVGILDTSPSYELDVNGTGRFSDGILFGADTAAANTLHDYEEGDWTPTLNVDGTISPWSYAHYVKIGSLVQCWAACNSIQESGSQTADLIISGLPYAVEFNTNGGNVMMRGIDTNANNLNVYVVDDETIRIFESIGGSEWDVLDWEDINGFESIYVEFCYRTTQ
jgi:hypothetical protein